MATPIKNPNVCLIFMTLILITTSKKPKEYLGS